MIKYIDDKKVCSKCKELKDVSLFWNFKYATDKMYPSCKDCNNNDKKRYIINNREKYLQRRKIESKNFYNKNKDAVIKRTAAYQKNNIHLRRKILLNFYYGMSLEVYQMLVDKNKGRCHICNSLPERGRLYVDHCHVTQKIRGVLCIKCNSLLGFCKDNIKILNSAIEYIKKEHTYGMAKFKRKN